MLLELYIRNLAVIEELRLQFDRGLTVLSGDEGAGKSIIVDALSLLLGERGSSSLIRGKAESCLVEGVFLPEDEAGVEAILQEAGLELDYEGNLILTRELQAQGRNIARINGRAVPASLVRELGAKLVDIHKQTETMAILDNRRQMDLLDDFGALLERRNTLGSKIAELREKARELESLTGKDMESRRDLLEYQIAEIKGAGIVPGEDDALQQEMHILKRVEGLRESCIAACGKTYFGEQCASGLLHQAIKALRNAASIDPALNGYLETFESASLQLEEAARDLRRYADNLETRGERLAEVEERLRLLRQLRSKYGGSLEAVSGFAREAEEELESLQNIDDRKQRLAKERAKLDEEAGELARRLSEDRQRAAVSLKERVNHELTELGLPFAMFETSVKQEEDQNGLLISGKRYAYNRDGIDKVEFLGVTNPGVPMMPLAEIASGGETCRFMLSLKSALQQADRVPTLVFDEVDSGVSGRGAAVIGRKLVALAKDRQVIAITHLPQIACFGDNHYHVAKEILGARAFTRVEHVEGERRLHELAAMLGGRTNQAMLQTARELMSQADAAR
jgi:DNA repair protein RecN (Recombination protein N)